MTSRVVDRVDAPSGATTGLSRRDWRSWSRPCTTAGTSPGCWDASPPGQQALAPLPGRPLAWVESLDLADVGLFVLAWVVAVSV
jgi:hypothetical protein